MALLALLLPVLSFAYCTPAAVVEERVGLCEENFHFVREADACVVKLNAEVAAATAKMNAGFTRNDGRNQSVNYNSSGKDYSLSSETLAALIKAAEAARADVQSYYPLVVEQDDQEELPEGEEATIPCYFRTRAAIVHVSNVLGAKIQNLKNAKSIADAHNGVNGTREANNSVIGPAPVTGGRAGQGAGAKVPSGVSRNPASDITGTDKAKEKARQSSKALEKK